MKIIGITGKMYAGKTTISEYVMSHNNNVYKLSFASLLKYMILKSGLCTKEELWGEKTDFSRLMLQKIGTDIIRNQIDQNFWVNKMKEAIDGLSEINQNAKIIIDDVRFKNEANLIKKYKNSVLIRVDRPSMKSASSHRSETEQDQIEVDITILNDGALKDLEEKVKEIICF
jgi:hypothetical protein